MVNLGGLDEADSEALDINDFGEVVGVSDDRAVIWLPPAAYGLPAGISDLGLGANSEALAINNVGEVVGRVENSWSFVWQNGTITVLEHPWYDTMWRWTQVQGINDQGQVVGKWIVRVEPSLEWVAGTFLWDETNGFVDTTPPCVAYCLNMSVPEINAFGQSVILSGPQWYFYYAGTSALMDAGCGWPEAINDAADAVGTYGQGHCLLTGGAQYDFSELLDPCTPWEPDESALDINNNGEIVGGAWDYDNDAWRAFIMTPGIDRDCNVNGIADHREVAAGSAADCQSNCVLDICDIAAGTSLDNNGNGQPDECEVCIGDEDCADGQFCNGEEVCSNGVCRPGLAIDCADGVSCTVDWCDEIADACVNAPSNGLCNDGMFCNGEETCDQLLDCQAGIPPCLPGEVCNEAEDTCEYDCNTNGLLDGVEIAAGTSPDCNANGVPDDCDLAAGTSADRDESGVPDECETCAASPGSGDANSNGIIDLDDYAIMAMCLSGPDVWVGPSCAAMDMDGDCDVDLGDYAWFQQAFGGPSWPTYLTPSDDATIDRKRPDVPLGSGTQLQVRNDDGGSLGWEIDTLIRFDLEGVPTGVSIESATLHIYYYAWEDNNPAGRTHRCRRLELDWDEAFVTWNGRPAWSSEISAEATVPGSPGQWMSWDVTADVQAFVAEPDMNFGWVLRDEQAWGGGDIPYTRSWSKEHGDHVPYLEIVYAPDTSGACCLADGNCIDVESEESCAAASGDFQGVLTECATAGCPQPEACCLGDGSCRDLTPEACANSNGTAQGSGTDCQSTVCPQLEACCYYAPVPTCEEQPYDMCADAGGIPQGADTDCGAACPLAEPSITLVRSLATHGLGVGELGIVIMPGHKVEPRETGLNLVEVTFGAPMDAVTCEDTGNLSIVGVNNGAQFAVSADLYPTNVLRIALATLPDEDCFAFDLTGMLSADLAPVSNPTFNVVALRGDMNDDFTVNSIDSTLVKAHWGQTPSATTDTARYDYDVSGLIDPTDSGLVGLLNGNHAPSCP